MTQQKAKKTAPNGHDSNGNTKGVIPYIPEEIDNFEREVKRFRAGEWEPNAFMALRLRQGVYGQRQPDVQMMRVKIPYGGLTALALEALGEVARKFVPLKKGHITTRENIQFHHVNLDHTPEAMRILGAAGLTSREACGNTVRNVTSCPMAGVCAREPFDVTPYVAAFARYFVRRPLVQKMPRKFKAAFSGCDLDCAITSIHDLGFTPQVRVEDGVEKKGFKVTTGGGLSIMPRIADTLYDFVPVEDYLQVSEAVLRIFNRCDELRKNKMKARIKFYIHRIGIEAFRREVEEELKKPWAQKPIDPTPYLYLDDEEKDAPPPSSDGKDGNGHVSSEFDLWRATNVAPQKQVGYHLVYVRVPLGDIYEHQFPLLAQIARQYAGGRARITHQQNLVFRWVPEAFLYAVWQELKRIGLAEPEVHTITDVTSCPGTDSCKLGITSSTGLARSVIEKLEKMDIQDPLVKGLHVKMSGCPNACGQHHIANIGFHGAATRGEGGGQVPAYELFLGGSYEGASRIGTRVRGRIPSKRVPEAVERILQFYQEKRQGEERFNDFVDRLGPAPFEEFIKQFEGVGPLNRENIQYYLDWDKTVLYKLERGEGECSV